MKENLVKVGDVFQVERRLKEIDAGYEVFYNKKAKRFEVYITKNGKCSLAVVSPYSELDVRLVNFVRKTRVERAEKIFAEIEAENEKIVEAEKRLKEEIKKEKLKELARKIKLGG